MAKLLALYSGEAVPEERGLAKCVQMGSLTAEAQGDCFSGTQRTQRGEIKALVPLQILHGMSSPFPRRGEPKARSCSAFLGSYVREETDKCYWKERWAGCSVSATDPAGITSKLSGLRHMHFCSEILRHRN